MNANCSKKAMLAIAGDLYLFQPSEATLENLRFWPIRLTIPCDSLSQSSICAWQCKFYEVGPQKSLRPGKVPAVTHNPEIEREEPRRVAFHAPPCLRVGPWRDSARAARKSHVTLQLRPPFRPDRVWAWQYSGVSSEPGLVRDGAAATLLRLLEGSIRAVLRQRGCARSLTEALKSSESVFLFQALCPQTPASYLFHFITGNRLAPECMLLAVRWARAANARRASLSCWQSTRTGHQPFKLVSRRLG